MRLLVPSALRAFAVGPFRSRASLGGCSTGDPLAAPPLARSPVLGLPAPSLVRLARHAGVGWERTTGPHVSQDVSGVSHSKKVRDWQGWCLPHSHRHVGRPPSSSGMVTSMRRTAVNRLVPWFAPTGRWVHPSRTVWCPGARTRVTWCRSPRGTLVMPMCSWGARPLSRSSDRTSQTGPAVAAGSGHNPGRASRAG